jgi:hypothetical protein
VKARKHAVDYCGSSSSNFSTDIPTSLEITSAFSLTIVPKCSIVPGTWDSQLDHRPVNSDLYIIRSALQSKFGHFRRMGQQKCFFIFPPFFRPHLKNVAAHTADGLIKSGWQFVGPAQWTFGMPRPHIFKATAGQCNSWKCSRRRKFMRKKTIIASEIECKKKIGGRSLMDFSLFEEEKTKKNAISFYLWSWF